LFPISQIALTAVKIAVFVQVDIGAPPGWRYDGAASVSASGPIDSHEEVIFWKKRTLVRGGRSWWKYTLVDAILNIPDVS
jgi:hypothetical protein